MQITCKGASAMFAVRRNGFAQLDNEFLVRAVSWGMQIALGIFPPIYTLPKDCNTKYVLITIRR